MGNWSTIATTDVEQIEKWWTTNPRFNIGILTGKKSGLVVVNLKTIEEADLERYLATEKELYYVLIYKGKLVGCGGINFADNRTIGKISWDIIHPDYQGKSLGTHLLKYRINKLNSLDTIKRITVRTSQRAYKPEFDYYFLLRTL